MEIDGKLKVSNPSEIGAPWSQVGSTPSELANWLSRIFSVKITTDSFDLNVVISDSEPETREDRLKVWFNNGPTPSINIPQNEGERYATIYQYPPNVPFLYVGGDESKPADLRKLSPTELDKFGLTNPEDASYYYVIFEV